VPNSGSLLPGQCTNVLLCIDVVTARRVAAWPSRNHIASPPRLISPRPTSARGLAMRVIMVTITAHRMHRGRASLAETGCTPGFWKNCTIHWGPTGYRTDQSVSSVFTLGSCCTSLGNLSLMGALNLGGGSGVCGGAQNLLRAAVAALLNATSPELDYPFTGQEVIAMVSAALQSCDRGMMLALASELDRDNNLGCGNANGGLPCPRLSDVPRVAPTRSRMTPGHQPGNRKQANPAP
jgi:hypothetical protein